MLVQCDPACPLFTLNVGSYVFLARWQSKGSAQPEGRRLVGVDFFDKRAGESSTSPSHFGFAHREYPQDLHLGPLVLRALKPLSLTRV
jgi:hypothetical protein